MSDIKIEVVAVDVTQPEGKKYQQMELMYKNLSFQGKAESKKINSYYGKAVFPILADAKKGDVFTIKREKEGEYWQWVGITSGAADSGSASSSGKPAAGAATGSSGGTNRGGYVDDAKKQVMIIRQSSISSAVNLVKTLDGKNTDPAAVIGIAKQFEAYVLGFEDVAKTDTKVAKSAELPNDPDLADDEIPF